MKCQKDKFNIPPDITYLNTAYMSPLMNELEKEGHLAIGRKQHPWKIQSADFFLEQEDVKALFSQLIDNPEPDRIAIVPSASYGIANVVRNIDLQKNDEILLVEEQFPSNVYSWMRKAKECGAKLVFISPEQGSGSRGASWNERFLDAINDRTAVVALPHVHWSEGICFDLKAIREKTLLHNARMIIDGSQSIGALPFSVKELQPDALVTVGYKWMMASYSIGLAYYNAGFDKGIPIEESWMNRKGSENFAGLVNYQDLYKTKANRYNVGQSSNFFSMPILKKAIQQLLEWQPENIQAYCKDISKETLVALTESGFAFEDEKYRAAHLFGIKVPEKVDAQQLKKKLETEKIFISIRGNYIRVSPHVFNTENDFIKLKNALLAVL